MRSRRRLVVALLGMLLAGSALLWAADRAVRARVADAGVRARTEWGVSATGPHIELRDVRARRGGLEVEADRAIVALAWTWPPAPASIAADGVVLSRGAHRVRFERLEGERLGDALQLEGVGAAHVEGATVPFRLTGQVDDRRRFELRVGGIDADLLRGVRLRGRDVWAQSATVRGRGDAWTALRVHGVRTRLRGMELSDAEVHIRPGEPVELARGRLTPPGGLPPLTGLTGRWDGETLELTGRAAGGRFTAIAPLKRGVWRPRALWLEAQDAQLATLAPLLPPDARLSGRADVQVVALPIEDSWRAPTWANVTMRVRGATVGHPALAPAPVEGVRFDLSGVLRVDPGARHVALEDGVLRMGRAHAALALGYTPEALALDVRMGPVPCQYALNALPRDLLGPVADARLSGELGTRVQLDLPFADPFALDLELEGFSRACAVTALNLPAAARPPAVELDDDLGGDVDWMARPFVWTPRSPKRSPRVGPGAAGYVSLGALPAYVPAAMYVSEEVTFFRGDALSPHLLERALRFDLSRRRFVYGGSTITQQLVKNLFLDRRKTLARKLQEAVVAARVADAIPRRRLLEIYVNIAELGPGVFGVGAASRYYFGKRATALTPAETVFLARMKPNPRHGGWVKRRGFTADDPVWRRYNGNILDHLVRVGALSPATADATRGFVLRWTPDGTYLGDRREGT